ncbi:MULTISPECIES: DUF2500 domain-containing protein [Tenebrionibacter/Tenebrionicola group]|jgi:hypothetical protein|uniref:DUF2500 domain-containing protein n=2 Tax=Tenebrionibacter/Tenebrionicola group TaxID=2969848 RepID=A0A8K0V544_9ENTR|nr:MULTISPECIES: DUF2500 domain-containing protein [Tenebrionibacter/Tenebrionicola group]MBK4715295.1 DUF2500 domain-containing protein [Tenebrionibacter intestinalis]MBV4413088.1 DUF2500 domain-containing protein [Tenebrionicola larvae]MBV5096041.1 DUF2500 domain-containing protein [Tenebrionicola larvae]
MNKPPFFFIVIVALIVVLASFRFMHQRRVEAENDAQPLASRSVAVAAKRETPANDRRSRQREVTGVEDSMRYEVQFRPLNGGALMRFRVSAAQYHALSVGQRGSVRYRGSRYEGFIPAPAP